MSLTIRVASTEDINEILRMMVDFNAIDDYPFDKEIGFKNIVYLLNHPEVGKIWLLLIDKKIIGYIVLTFGFSFEYEGKDAFIDELFIKAPFRGKGYGDKALDFILDEAKALGVKAIHLEVESHNTEGNRLYSNKGFAGNNRRLLTKRI